MNEKPSFRELYRQIGQAMKAGAAAAENGVPITQCPYGECRGREDENSANHMISGWVTGYLEKEAERACDRAFDDGMRIALGEIEFAASGGNISRRTRQAIADGWAHALFFDMPIQGRMQ